MILEQIRKDILFAPSECWDILSIPRSYRLGAISNAGVQPRVRLVEEGDVGAQWIEDRVESYVRDVCVPHFQLPAPLFIKLTFLKYKAGFFYLKHSDVIKNAPRTRVVSLSIGLDECYTGGDLAFYDSAGDLIEKHKSVTGQVIAFNSALDHEVLPIETGVRHVLVAWVSTPSVSHEAANLV